MNSKHDLHEIEKFLCEDSESIIAKEDVLRWMKNDDIEVLGALFSLISNENTRDRITPNISFLEGHQFAMHFLKRVLIENPRGEWSGTRYEAGWTIANTFKWYWDSAEIQKSAADDIKNMLSNVFREGDTEVRVCVITAILEHLLGREDMAGYFKDWTRDEVLMTAYTEALGYSSDITKMENLIKEAQKGTSTGSGLTS